MNRWPIPKPSNFLSHFALLYIQTDHPYAMRGYAGKQNSQTQLLKFLTQLKSKNYYFFLYKLIKITLYGEFVTFTPVIFLYYFFISTTRSNITIQSCFCWHKSVYCTLSSRESGRYGRLRTSYGTRLVMSRTLHI